MKFGDAADEAHRRHALASQEAAPVWVLRLPRVTAPEIGPRDGAQHASSLRALEVRLTPEDLAALDAL